METVVPGNHSPQLTYHLGQMLSAQDATVIM